MVLQGFLVFPEGLQGSLTLSDVSLGSQKFLARSGSPSSAKDRWDSRGFAGDRYDALRFAQVRCVSRRFAKVC